MFNRNPFKKHSRHKSLNNSVMPINLLDKKKDFCLKGEIIIIYCKGHDYCIILFFVFNDFYENHRRLLSKIFYCR